VFRPVFRVPLGLRIIQKSRRFRCGSILSCSLFSKNSAEPFTFSTRRTPFLPMGYAYSEDSGSTGNVL